MKQSKTYITLILALGALLSHAGMQYAASQPHPKIAEIMTEEQLADWAREDEANEAKWRRAEQLEGCEEEDAQDPTRKGNCVPARCIIYVNAKAAKNGDGTSWKTAYNNLQSALDKAKSNGGANEIWVAKGVYTPTKVYEDLTVSGGKPSFTLQDQTFLYGGFKGTESKRSKRNPRINVTVLNGDINNNDLPISDRPGPEYPEVFSSLNPAYVASKADNSRHVVIVDNQSEIAPIPQVTIDGFTIQKGFAGVLPSIPYELDNRYAFRGGGLFAQSASITLRNVIFDDCSSWDDLGNLGGAGGAIYMTSLFGHSSISMNKVVIRNSYASFIAAAAYTIGTNSSCDVLVENYACYECGYVQLDHQFDFNKVTFRNNFAYRGCSGIEPQYLEDEIESSRFTNCVFENNQGGNCSCISCFNDSGLTGGDRIINSPWTIKNCVFSGNTSRILGFDGEGLSCAICIYSSSGTIENNVFENNSAPGGGAICVQQPIYLDPLNTLVTIQDNCFKNNKQNNVDPLATSTGGGAIHFRGPLVSGSILNNIFCKNKSEENGGAIVIEDGSATIKNNGFALNTAEKAGSAIYAIDSTLNSNVVACNTFKKFDNNTVVTQALKKKGDVRKAQSKPVRPSKEELKLMR